MKYKVISILTAVAGCLLMVNTAFAEDSHDIEFFQSVPEPATLVLIVAGGAALYAARRLTNKKTKA